MVHLHVAAKKSCSWIRPWYAFLHVIRYTGLCSVWYVMFHHHHQRSHRNLKQTKHDNYWWCFITWHLLCTLNSMFYTKRTIQCNYWPHYSSWVIHVHIGLSKGLTISHPGSEGMGYFATWKICINHHWARFIFQVFQYVFHFHIT